jgi:hypothetical protein
MSFLGQPRSLVLLQLIWSAPILLAMAHDAWRRRLVHPVYVLGLVVLLLEGPAVRGLVRGTGAWHDATAWLATWFA